MPGEDQHIIWEKESKNGTGFLLKDSINTETLSNGTLSIKMRNYHQGVYKCFDTNSENKKIGNPSKRIKIVLAYLKDAYEEAETYEITERPSHEVQLSCIIEGVPPPSITWFRSSVKKQKLRKSRDPRVQNGQKGYQVLARYDSSTKKTHSTLVIPSLSVKHQGNYYCSACNDCQRHGSNQISSMYSIEVKTLPNLGSLICPDKVTTGRF